MTTAHPEQRRPGAFTITEVVMALLVGGIMITGIVSGFIQYSQQAEWSAYSMAAQMQAMRRMEQVRAARWQPGEGLDDVVPTNFPPVVDPLDVSTTGGKVTWATNITQITDVSTNPPLRMIRVDCTWSFQERGVMTNTIVTYRAPDQ